ILAHLLAASARAQGATDPRQALALAEKAAAMQPTSADAQLALGEALISVERGAPAEAPLRASLELEPELAPKAARLWATAGLGCGPLESFLGQQIAARPDKRAPFELALAVLFSATERPDLALERLRRLVELTPRFWEARKELGNLLLAQGRAEELRDDYREILSTLGEPALGFVCTSCRQRL